MTARCGVADRTQAAILGYLLARRTIIEAGFEEELEWQEEVCRADLTESRFLKESAWVVLSAGMREAVVRRVFPAIEIAFGGLSSARAAVDAAAEGGRDLALRSFGHVAKIDAIVTIAVLVDEIGFREVGRRIAAEGVAFLRTLPYIGPVTALHLAKNLGYEVAKPDRHLVRIARVWGFGDPQSLCVALRDVFGDPVPVIDLVLWRYATLDPSYVRTFSQEAERVLSH